MPTLEPGESVSPTRTMGNESEGVEKDEEFYQKREWTTDAPK